MARKKKSTRGKRAPSPPNPKATVDSAKTPSGLSDEIETQTFGPLDDYLPVPLVEEAGTVVVQDFDPTDPGAEIAEPTKVMSPLDSLARTKVLQPHDRVQRKRDRGSRE